MGEDLIKDSIYHTHKDNYLIPFLRGLFIKNLPRIKVFSKKHKNLNWYVLQTLPEKTALKRLRWFVLIFTKTLLSFSLIGLFHWVLM